MSQSSQHEARPGIVSMLLLMKNLETHIVQRSVIHSFYLEKYLYYHCFTPFYPSLSPMGDKDVRPC